MPRKARETSNTKVYHIIWRGNDKQDIFLDNQDYKKFIKELTHTKEKYHYQLYAYCLMTNHIHLILFDKENNFSKAMQSLAVSYSSYFRKKYDKVGHLFQNRFLSKCIQTREYLIQLCRYIHQNPVKAKIAKVDEYRWSSYQEFIHKNKLVNTEIIMSMFGEAKQDAVKNFVEFHNIEKEDDGDYDYIEYEMVNKVTDEQLKKLIEKVLKIDNVIEIKRYNITTRNEKLRQLKQIKGTSKAQIARVIGINRKIVERAMKE